MQEYFLIGMFKILIFFSDDMHLLMFLRRFKFNVDKAMKTCEKFYISPRKYPQFMLSTDECFEKTIQMIKDGYFCPLQERDHQGCKILLLNVSKWNIDKFSVLDSARTFLFVTTMVMEEEETQIAGIKIILDYTGVTLKHLLNPIDGISFMDLMAKCSIARGKTTVFMNLPASANFFFQIVKSGLQEKLAKRTFSVSDEGLKDFINLKLMPKEYGGSKNYDDMIQDFLKFIDLHRERVDKVWKIKLNWNKIDVDRIWTRGENDSNVVGSFRKLEID